MSLLRIIYRSENALGVAGLRIFAHYHDIVSTARYLNELRDISGFLMFDRLRYHQILEGEAEVVEKLYRRIEQDTRHRNVELLAHVGIQRRDFPDWSMGAFLSDDRKHPLLERHGIALRVPVEADQFLRFALQFATLEPEMA